MSVVSVKDLSAKLLDLSRFVKANFNESVAEQQLSTSEKLLNLCQKQNEKFTLRDHMPAHLTSSICILNPQRTAILLTHHKKLGLWLQLGGHLEAGETLEQAAVREGSEESGMPESALQGDLLLFDCDIHSIPARKTEPEHFHLDLRYAIKIKEDQPLTISDESHDLKWVPLTQIEEHTNEESLIRVGMKLKHLVGMGLI